VREVVVVEVVRGEGRTLWSQIIDARQIHIDIKEIQGCCVEKEVGVAIDEQSGGIRERYIEVRQEGLLRLLMVVWQRPGSGEVWEERLDVTLEEGM